jgi:hypothetical protein
MSGDPTPYLDLVTSEHASAPNFLATVAASVQPFADLITQFQAMPSLYDLDDAIGQQLDRVGQWVGITRNIALPDDIYFSWDTNGLGWDQGIWFQQYDPTTNQFALPDDHYRLLLRAKIAANQWNGSIPEAYAAWSLLLGPYSMSVLIQDNQNMTMLVGVLGNLPDALTLALITGGYLTLKPCGVGVVGYVAPSVEDAPFFGWDVENGAISGWDTGAWGVSI